MTSLPARIFTIFALILFAFCVIAKAQLPNAANAKVISYLSAIEAAENNKSHDAVEKAFYSAKELKEALFEIGEEDWTIIERLSEQDYKKLESQLRGILLNREEVILAEPEVEFWVKLADEHGNDADKAFFKAYRFTYPYSVWAVYLEQQTDVIGCARFGSLMFVETYKVWSQFVQSHPNSYREWAREELGSLQDELLGSSCACGTVQEVIKELEEFNKVFPGSPAYHNIQERINKLRSRSSDVRERCISG